MRTFVEFQVHSDEETYQLAQNLEYEQGLLPNLAFTIDRFFLGIH